MLSLGMSENFLQLSAIFYFASASFNTSLKKYCHALFLTCKGSTWAWSINLPIKGTNSRLLFLRAMNSVTLLRNCFSFSCFSDKVFLNSSTSFAILILPSYFNGCHKLILSVANVANANVCAIHKKGKESDPSNYGPVSLTCIASKVLEHIVHSQAMKHLSRYGVLTDC